MPDADFREINFSNNKVKRLGWFSGYTLGCYSAMGPGFNSPVARAHPRFYSWTSTLAGKQCLPVRSTVATNCDRGVGTRGRYIKIDNKIIIMYDTCYCMTRNITLLSLTKI